MPRQIPITFVYPAIALPIEAAAKSIGISRWTLRRRNAQGLIKITPDKTVAVEELQRYCREQAA